MLETKTETKTWKLHFKNPNKQLSMYIQNMNLQKMSGFVFFRSAFPVWTGAFPL
jgi:hypothetical protein